VVMTASALSNLGLDRGQILCASSGTHPTRTGVQSSGANSCCQHETVAVDDLAEAGAVPGSMSSSAVE